MPGDYLPEDVPFSAATCTDPFLVLRGPGPAAVADGVDVFTRMGEDLQYAVDGLKGAGLTLAGAHSGVAADASRQVLRALEVAADQGREQAGKAVLALDHQGEYVRLVRDKVGAIAVPVLPRPGSQVEPQQFDLALTEATRAAEEAGEQYRGSANVGFGMLFPRFEPAPQQSVDASTGPDGPSGAGIGAGGAVPVVPAAGGLPAGAAPAVTPPVAADGPAPAGGPGATPMPIPGVGTAPGGRPGVVPASRPVTGPAAVPAPQRTAPNTPGTAGWGAPEPGRTPGVAGSGWRPGQPWTTTGPEARRTPGTAGALGTRGVPGAGPSPGHGSPGGAGSRGGTSPGLRGIPSAEPPANPQRPGGVLPQAAGAGPPPTRAAAGLGHVPLLPSGAGGNQDTEHHRPPWLLQDDPEMIWFAGLPPYTDPVIEGDRP